MGTLCVLAQCAGPLISKLYKHLFAVKATISSIIMTYTWPRRKPRFSFSYQDFRYCINSSSFDIKIIIILLLFARYFAVDLHDPVALIRILTKSMPMLAIMPSLQRPCGQSVLLDIHIPLEQMLSVPGFEPILWPPR